MVAVYGKMGEISPPHDFLDQRKQAQGYLKLMTRRPHGGTSE